MIVSYETMTPRSSISSSTSRNDSGERKYSHTQWEMISAGYRCPLYDGDMSSTDGPLHRDQPEDPPILSANVTAPCWGFLLLVFFGPGSLTLMGLLRRQSAPSAASPGAREVPRWGRE